MTKSPQPKTWRDVLPVHPAADLFPLMSAAELRELGEDIKKNGLHSPIVLGHWDKDDPKFKLWDGRNRLDALDTVGLLSYLADDTPSGTPSWPDFLIKTRSPQVVPVQVLRECNGYDPYAYVLSANIHRRHLTTEQKRELIEKLLKAKPQSSDRTIARQTKVDHKTVGKARSKLEATGEIPQLKKTIGADGKSRSKPKTAPKPTWPPKTDPIGSPPVRYSEAPATSVPPEVSRKVENFITLENFTSRAMGLIKLIMNNGTVPFAKTALSDDDIRYLAKFFIDLSKIRQGSGFKSAEVSVEQRQAEHAAFDETGRRL